MIILRVLCVCEEKNLFTKLNYSLKYLNQYPKPLNSYKDASSPFSINLFGYVTSVILILIHCPYNCNAYSNL